MHTNTGPNKEPETSETKHPDTEEPRPQEAGQEASGGGGGTEESPPSPERTFEDILKQMREVAGAAGGGTPTSSDELRRAMRADLMDRVVGLLPSLIEYISVMNSGGASEEDQPGAEEVEEPVAEYIPTGIPVGFGSRPFDVESVLFGDQVKKQKRSARHHGFMLGLGLGSTMSALGAATLAREFIWNLTDLSTDFGSAINAAFGKKIPAMPHIMRAVAPRFDSFPSVGEYFRTSGPRPGPRAPRPDIGLKYGASFPDETPGEYEMAESDSAPAPAVELPDFEEFLGRVAALKDQIDAGAVDANPEIKGVFDQFGKLFGQFIPASGPGRK